VRKILNNPLARTNITACIVLAAIAPFTLCAITGQIAGHRSCPMIIFYWLITITGLLTAKKIRELGRHYALTISEEFIIYKKPFTTKLIKIPDLLAVHAGPDKNLILKTLNTTLIVPLSIFTSDNELARIKSRLEQYAPPSCRIDMRNLSMEML
jgi:hypothetical protein